MKYKNVITLLLGIGAVIGSIARLFFYSGENN